MSPAPSKSAPVLLLLCVAQHLSLAAKLCTEASEIGTPAARQLGNCQDADEPSVATSLLSRLKSPLSTAVEADLLWVFCAGQWQECMCHGAVRWGVPGKWHEISPVKEDEWNRVTCSIDKLPDVAPGDGTKHCQCGVQPGSAFARSMNPALLVQASGSMPQTQPTISCEIIKAGKVAGQWAESLWEATSAFCADEWDQPNSDVMPGDRAMSLEVRRSLMQAWVDHRFANNYKRLFDTSGWAPRAFVNYYAGVPDGKHTKMTEQLINSVHAFSAEPIIVFHFGTQTPSDWNEGRWPRLVLVHAAPIPAEDGRSFNFNKLRTMLLARVRSGIVLDSDQFVAPGADALFQRTEQEITQDYAMPILPAHFLDRTPKDTGAYWARYCPSDDDCRFQTARWGHAHPTWTHWALPWIGKWLRRNFLDEILPPREDGAMSALRVVDVPEDEDLLNIATWEDGGTKQWCKYDIPSPYDFGELLDVKPGSMECNNCGDIAGDSRWYPNGVARAFFTAHHAVDPENTKYYIEAIKEKQKEGPLPPPIWYHGHFFATGQEMKAKYPDSNCII